MTWHERLEDLLKTAGIHVLQSTKTVLQLQYQGMEASLNVANIEKRIADRRIDQEQILQGVIAQVLASFQQVDSATDRIFYPRVLPFLKEKSLSAPWSQVLIPEYLEVGIVEDLSSHFRFLQPLDLVTGGLSIHTVKEQAKKNLRMVSQTVQWEAPSDGVLVWESIDGLASAMLLVLDELVSKKEFYVAVPSRDSLWICYRESEIPIFVAKSKQAYQQAAYPLSAHVFSWHPALAARF